MRILVTVLIALLFLGATAVPLPPTNPDPFHVQQQGQAAPVPAPPQAFPVPVQAATPSLQSDILSWIQTALMALATMIFGKLAIKPPSLPGAASSAHDPSQIALALKAALHPNGTSIIADPAFRSMVDQAILQLVQSGIPGTAIQSGISLIPGVGPLGGIIEPMVRKAVEAALQSHLGAPASGAVNPNPMGQSSVTDQLQLLIDQLKAKHSG